MGSIADKDDLIHIGVQGMYWAEIALSQAFCFSMGDIWDGTHETYVTNSHAQLAFEDGTYVIVHMNPKPASLPRYAEITRIRTYNAILRIHVDMEPTDLPGYVEWLRNQQELHEKLLEAA